MRHVKFTVDFRGKLTGEVFHLAGEVAELRDDWAAQLVAEQRAVYMDAPVTRREHPPEYVVNPYIEETPLVTPPVAALIETQNESIADRVRTKLGRGKKRGGKDNE